MEERVRVPLVKVLTTGTSIDDRTGINVGNIHHAYDIHCFPRDCHQPYFKKNKTV